MKENIEFKTEYPYNYSIITYKGIKFEGIAQCHANDDEFFSERTGLCIAEARATIKKKQFIRDFELKPQLKILKHLYKNIQNSKYFNPKSHETYRIIGQIAAIEKEIAMINTEITEEKKYLKEYIDNKDKFYRKIEEQREKDKNN